MVIQRLAEIRNKETRTRTGMASISGNIREVRLRWVGHLKRNSEKNEVNMEDGNG